MSKRTDSPGLGSLTSAALTAVSTLVVTGFAAIVGVVIAREFGRTDETDGFFAAYGVFIVIVLAAQAIRMAVLPALAGAAAERRLAAELSGFAIALALIAAPMILVAELAAGSLAELLTGGGSESAQTACSDALRWLIPAATAHLFAGLAASGLAALDDYATAAFGYAAGSAAGLTLILARIEPDGIISVAWGVSLNAAIAIGVPLTGLSVRALRSRMPAGAMRPAGSPIRDRLGAFAAAAALPIALQMLYVVCLPFAGRSGVGSVTSFGYAYLAAASLVAMSASSLGLVSSVPLSRAGVGPDEAGRHVVSASWLALAFVCGATGVFAFAGADLIETVLGEEYGGDVGVEVGRLVAALSPWMVASVGVSVAFPLVFVAHRTRSLPWLAIVAVVIQVPLAWGAWRAFELVGLALALAFSTFLVLAVLSAELGAARLVASGLGGAALTLAGFTVAAFLPPAIVLGSTATAIVGLILYVALVTAARPRGLRVAWEYFRTLG